MNTHYSLGLPLEHAPHVAVGILPGMRRAVYPSATMYLSPPSERQLTRPGHTRRPPQDEIRYVKTDDIDFLVDPQSLPLTPITQSETLALIWVGLGKTLSEAADEQGNTPSTCHTYREKLFWKLGASSMVQAVSLAFEQRLLEGVPDRDYRPLSLTEREHEVLSVLSKSKNKEEVAAKLHLTHSTVKTHTNHLLKKNAISHCAHATLRAYLAGQLPLEK